MISAFEFAQEKAKNGVSDDFWYETMEDYAKEYAKQLLSDYTDKIVDNVEVIQTGDVDSDGMNYEFYEVDKRSITSQLEPFLKTIL